MIGLKETGHLVAGNHKAYLLIKSTALLLFLFVTFCSYINYFGSAFLILMLLALSYLLELSIHFFYFYSFLCLVSD